MTDTNWRISGAIAEDLTVDEIRENRLQTMHQGIGFPLRPVSNAPLEDSGEIFNPETVASGAFMQFMSQGWEAGKFHPRGSTVTNGEWTMVANVYTLDSPYPVPGEDSNFGLGDTPAFVTQSDSSVVYSGHSYTFNEAVWLKTIRAWVTQLTADTSYRIVVIREDPGQEPVVSIIDDPLLTVGAWRNVAIANKLVPAGSKFIIYIDALNSGADQTVTGGWTYSGQDNVSAPPAQSWNVNNARSILRIDKTDLDGTDRTTELLGFTLNTTVTFANTGNPSQFSQFRVTDDPPVDQGTYVQYAVILQEEGEGGVVPATTTTMTALVPIPQPTEYAEVAGSIPSFTQNVTVAGFLQFDGVDQVGDANSYGIDIEVESAESSPDWDVLAYNPLT